MAIMRTIYILSCAILLFSGCSKKEPTQPNTSAVPCQWTVQYFDSLTHGFMDIDFIDKNTGWVVSNDGTILYTTNGGNTWTLDVCFDMKRKPAINDLLRVMARLRAPGGCPQASIIAMPIEGR